MPGPALLSPPYAEPSPRPAARSQPVVVSRGRVGRGSVYPIIRNGGANGTTDQFDDLKAGPGAALWLGGTRYLIFYEGVDTSLDPDGAGANGYNAAIFATSNDGTNWAKTGRVLSPAASPSWENSELCPNDVFWDAPGNRWAMLYHGGNNSPADGRRIGIAHSPGYDSILTGGTWTKYASNPVLTDGANGAWDDGWVADMKILRHADGTPHVIDGRIWGFYVGRAAGTTAPGKVGLASTADYGLTWEKHPANPVFQGTAATWDKDDIMAFAAVWEAGVYRGWYVGRDATANANGLGYAWSSNMVEWTKGSANPVLGGADAVTASDSVFVYRDAGGVRIQHGTYDFGVSPAIRGKAEAFERAGARYFNGTTSRVDVSDEVDFDFERTSPFTLAAWIYLDRVGSGAVIAKQQNGGGFPGYNLGLQAGGQIAMDLRAATGGGAFQRRGNTVLAAGAWRHVCGTYDGSNTVAGIKLYLDGTAETMTDLDTNLTASILNNVELQIGARGGSGAPTFYFPGGRIEEPMVWNVALTAAEVTSVYKGGQLPRQDALVYRLDAFQLRDLAPL